MHSKKSIMNLVDLLTSTQDRHRDRQTDMDGNPRSGDGSQNLCQTSMLIFPVDTARYHMSRLVEAGIFVTSVAAP